MPPTLLLQTLSTVIVASKSVSSAGGSLVSLLPQPVRAAASTAKAAMRSSAFMRPPDLLRLCRGAFGRCRVRRRFGRVQRGVGRGWGSRLTGGGVVRQLPGKSTSFICRNPRSRLGAGRHHRFEIGGASGIRFAERDVDIALDLGDPASELAGLGDVQQRQRLLLLVAIREHARSRSRATIARSGSSLRSIVKRSFSIAASGAVTTSALATSRPPGACMRG